MSDGLKKPKNYRRGRDLSIAEADATAARCTASFPCLADIYVFAGVNPPCAACAPRIDSVRESMGWTRDGEFWTCDFLLPEQRAELDERIAARRGTTAHTPGPWHVLFGGLEGDTHFTIASKISTDIVCDYAVPAPRPSAEVIANAKLIAAAPSLHALLAEAVERLPAWAGADDDAHGWWVRAKRELDAVKGSVTP